MLAVVASITSLLLGVGILLIGSGLLGTLLGVRAAEEAFGEATTGLVMSAYFLGFALGTYLCPTIIRRVGHIRAFAAMAAIASVTGILHALIVHPAAWALFRVVTGICIVGLYMVVESWLNVLSPNRWRGQIFAIYSAVTLIALGGGQFLILVGDVTGFVPFGLVSICLSLALVPIALTRVSQPPPADTTRMSLGDLFSTSPLGIGGALTAGLVTGAFWGMGPLFAHRLGLSEVGVAGFMAAVILGGAALQWPIGRLSDNHDRRRVLIGVAFAGAAVALAALLVMESSLPGLMVVAFTYGGLAFTIYGLSVAHVNDYLESGQVLEATRSLLLVHGVAATIGPAAVGLFMAHFGAGTLLAYFAAALASLGCFGLYRLYRRPVALPVEEQAAYVAVVRTSEAALELDPRAEAEPELELEPEPVANP